MTSLFAYGTFCQPAWRRAILGADYPARPARVRGWRRVALASGYLSVVRSGDALLDGVVVTLDALGWRIADAWEEVPRYARVEAVALTADGPLAAPMYVHASTVGAGAVPFEAAAFAALDEGEVEAAIGRFAAQMRALRETG
jgi:hypothetical protein